MRLNAALFEQENGLCVSAQERGNQGFVDATPRPTDDLAGDACGRSCAADEAGDRFAAAAGDYNAKRWKLAAEEFQAFLDKYPTHVSANQCYFFQGEALLQLGRCEAAHEKLQEYLRRESGGDLARQAMFRSGEAAYLAGQKDAAEKELGAFAKKYPDDRVNSFALPYLGEIALHKNENPLAESYFRECCAVSPRPACPTTAVSVPPGRWKSRTRTTKPKSYTLRLRKKLRVRWPITRSFIAVRCNMPRAGTPKRSRPSKIWRRGGRQAWKPACRLGRGWVLVKLDRLDEAYAIFQSLTADPKLGIEARYWLGLVQKAKHEWPEAAKTLLETAAAAPRHELLPAIRFHAGDALLQAGDAAAAARQFDLVLAEDAVNGNSFPGIDRRLVGGHHAVVGAGGED